jgi:hypothetical protein
MTSVRVLCAVYALFIVAGVTYAVVLGILGQ